MDSVVNPEQVSAMSAVANSGIALLCGGISGGVAGACALLLDSRMRCLRELAIQSNEVLSSHEAWVLEGEGSSDSKLSDHLVVKPCETSTGLWLRQVELRFVLDSPVWNGSSSLEEQHGNYFGVINGRRAWIIRDHLDIHSLSYIPIGTGLGV